MGNISARYQKKNDTAYDKKQMAEFDALFAQTQTTTPAAAPSPAPQAKPGVAASIGKGSFHGAKKAAHELFNSLDELSTWVAKKTGTGETGGDERHNFSNLLNKVTGISHDSLKAEEEGQGIAYTAASGITQFVTAFLPINRVAGGLTKGMKLAKAAKVGATVVKGAVTGGITSAVAFDPYEHRLSNMIESVPSLQNPITEYLAADPSDSKATARMKNGVENALMGIGFDLGIEGGKALFHSIKAFKAAKNLKASGKEGEEALAASQEVLARESKALRDLNTPKTEVDSVIQHKAKDEILDPNAKENHLNETEATAVVQPKSAGAVANPEAPVPPKAPAKGLVADPEFGPVAGEVPAAPAATEVNTAVDPAASPAVANPEVLPEVPKPLSPEEIETRLSSATKEGRIAALQKLEPARAIEDITGEVDAHLNANATARAEGRSIEVVSDIQGEQVPLTNNTPEGALLDYPEDSHLQLPDDARVKVSDQLPSGSLDTAEQLPKWQVEATPEEFQTKILDPAGKPYDLRTVPVLDEGILPGKLQQMAAGEQKTVGGFLESLKNTIGNESGTADAALLAKAAPSLAGGTSGMFLDYNGDGKVAGWEDIALGLAIGGAGGYVAGKAIRAFHNGTPDAKAAALAEIEGNFKQQIEDFKAAEEAFENALKGGLSPEAKASATSSLETLRSAREAMEKYEGNPAGLEKVLNRAWVKEKYKPLVKIPTGKSEAIVHALRDGKLDDVSREIGQDFNFAGIKAPEDLQEAIEGLTNLISDHIPEETAKMTRGVVSWEATKEGADELGINLHVVNSNSKDTRKLSERLLAGRIAMNSIKTPLIEVMDQILTHPDPPAELLMKFQEMTSLAAAIQAQVKGSQTEVARALNSMKIAADTMRMDFASVDLMMAQKGGKKGMVTAVQKLKEIMKEGNNVLTNRYLRGLTSNSSLRFLNELHRTVLLSNPITHAANISGNFLAGIVNAGEDTMAGIFAGRGLGDAKALFEGLAQKDTWSDALRYAKRAWTTSQSTIDPLITKIDGSEMAHGISMDTFKQTYLGQGADYIATALGMDGVLGRTIDESGKFLRTTFDALGAEDEFFKVLNFRGALHREAYIDAYRTAVGEGLQGAALAKRIGTLKAQLVDAPSEELFGRALETTRANTFTASPKGILGDANTFVAKHPILQLFIPFTRTPTNIINYVFDRVPGITLYQQEVRDALMNGTRAQKAEIAARWSAGGLIMSSALGLAAAGIVTGGGDTEMMAKKVSGWQPYSVKVGDKYYSYNRLDPISSLMGLAADTYDIMNHAIDEQDMAKASTAAMIAITRNLSSKTMLRGFTEMLDAVTQGDKKMTTFAKGFALSWIPAGVGAMEKTLDPVTRDAITFMDQVKAKLPGFSSTLPPARDIFGDVMMPEGRLGPDWLAPVEVSTASKDPVRQLFSDLGIDTRGDIRGMQMIDKVPLSPEQHSQYVESRGKMLKEVMDTLVNNPQFANLPDDKEHPSSKQAKIRDIMGRTKSAARGKLFQDHPDLLEKVKARHQEFADELQK